MPFLPSYNPYGIQSGKFVVHPARPDTAFYHIDDYIVGNLITEQGLSETKATDLYYSSNTYQQLIDESTGLYLKLWTDVYKLILQELKQKK
jgi:hypothetical protein